MKYQTKITLISYLLCFISIVIIFGFVSLNVYSKYSLCKKYYNEMPILACYTANVHLPAKTKD